jgi:uncharacterized protein YjbI with pentapeptide repeats
MKEVLFNESVLIQSDFQESDFKRVSFDRVDLRESQFSGVKLKGIDFSTSKIEGFSARYEDIQDLIINSSQSIDIARLVGVEVKY